MSALIWKAMQHALCGLRQHTIIFTSNELANVPAEPNENADGFERPEVSVQSARRLKQMRSDTIYTLVP